MISVPATHSLFVLCYYEKPAKIGGLGKDRGGKS